LTGHTYDDAIAAAGRRLAQAQIAAPVREARYLMSLVTGLDTAALIGRGREIVPGPVATTYTDYIARRAAHEPFQHIAGIAHFFGHEFICDARALVPRGDSEVVVETALARLRRGGGGHIADLGTGSGCLLISVLLARGDVTGTGVEIDARAASLARENVARHDVSARAEILERPWANWSGWNSADLIISNPPYIPQADIPGLDAEVRLFDPIQALAGGEDGLVAYREVTALAGRLMRPGAVLVFEIGHTQRQAVECLMRESGFGDIHAARDLGGRDRVVSAILNAY
jgi:release factor glutamine methyltransferase